MSRPPSYPGFTPQQISYLNAMFPNRCARLGMTEQQIWHEAGSRCVIEHITSQEQRRAVADAESIERMAFHVPAEN